jgi:hypothetical protein
LKARADRVGHDGDQEDVERLDRADRKPLGGLGREAAVVEGFNQSDGHHRPVAEQQGNRGGQDAANSDDREAAAETEQRGQQSVQHRRRSGLRSGVDDDMFVPPYPEAAACRQAPRLPRSCAHLLALAVAALVWPTRG